MTLNSQDSRESIASFYSNAGDIDYGKIPVTGEIQFGVDYNYRTSTLEISIRQCKDLAAADTKHHRSDPYVKTYLLPDKTRGGKRKTKVKKSTLSPVFDESLRVRVFLFILVIHKKIDMQKPLIGMRKHCNNN